MKIALLSFICLLCLLLTLPVSAQDIPAAETITYDSVVTDDLTSEAFYDWWFINVRQGDVVVVTMAAHGTLEPLIGILDPGGNLVARSEDGAPGGIISLEYTAPADGEMTVVATRVGNDSGTSTGEYQLQVRRANAPVERVNPYQEVTFRCQDYEVTNVATLEFAEDAEQAGVYRISVYGLDGFLPVIRVALSKPELTDCSSDSQAVNDDMLTLPGAATLTYAQNTETAAQLTITGAAEAGLVTLTIGSRNGAAGRYVAVVEGFSIAPADDADLIRVGQGPKAAELPLLVYMLAAKNTRLDPSMRFPDEAGEGVVCDDAGRRGCEDVPSVSGLKVTIAGAEVVGGRFDAGLLLPGGDSELRTVELGSFSGNTEGGYTLVLIGELK